MSVVQTIEDWKRLPELSIPRIATEADSGAVYMVKKVGFLRATGADCTAADLPTVVSPNDQCVLPTCVVVTDGGGESLCRLPLDLGQWVYDCVALSAAGMKPFPCRVELGLLRDRHYAQMV